MALASTGWAVAHLVWPAPFDFAYAVVAVALIAAGSIFSVPLPARMPIRVTLTPTAYMVCAAVLPTPWLVVCTAVGVSAAKVITRYPRSASLHKAVHNTSMDILAATAAGTLMQLAGVSPALGGIDGLQPSVSAYALGLTAAAMVVMLTEELVTTTAVSLATGRRFTSTLRYLWQTRLLVGAAETTISGVAVAVVIVDQRTLAALPVAMLVLHLALSYRIKLREERRAWERHAALADALTSRDLDAVVHTAARGAVELFGAQAAEIELSPDRRLVRADGQALVVYDGPGRSAEDLGLGTPSAVFEIGADATGLQGLLRLYLESPTASLSCREQATARALAATISTSIDNATAYQKLAAESASHALAATHDGLTGLLNRPSFTASIAHLEGPEVHVLVIGLENLRLINETFGRSVGDGLLAELARRLRAFFPSTDYRIGRISGSGLAVAVGNAPTEVVYHKACRAVLALRVKAAPSGLDLSVRASGGLARGPLGNAATLLTAAEETMWRSVQMGQDQLVALDVDRPSGVATGLDRSRVSLSFQPVVDLLDGQVRAVQALPGWLFSRYGLLPADEHVYQLVDDARLLDKIAERILARSLSAAQTWRDSLPQVPVVVPISPRAISSEIIQTTTRALTKYSMPGSSLILALSESAPVTDTRAAHRLREMGVRLLLDDFGSTSHSLASLSATKFSFVRIHPAYAIEHRWRESAAVIRAAVDLSLDLDMAVVVPHVSDARQRRDLVDLGCSLGSGPLFGDPSFPSEFREQLARWVPPAVDEVSSGAGNVVPLRRHRIQPSQHAVSP
ncbi:EAL domain-containing protein [Micromonospora endolithica]|uniref:EAL domain-containing protein n=1 Tax=Micromonospora endolithica TaxID=230091 RepID=UPI001EDCA37A|nr:EAL domain-containing protein [Micromonospora endolithica]